MQSLCHSLLLIVFLLVLSIKCVSCALYHQLKFVGSREALDKMVPVDSADSVLPSRRAINRHFILFSFFFLYFVIYSWICRPLLGLLCLLWWGPIWLRFAATKETRVPICVVDSQIVLTTQAMQSWASPSILLASPNTITTTLPGMRQPKRREEGRLTATAAAAAASFPPSHLRVGDRGGHSEQRASQEDLPFQSVSSQPTSSYHSSNWEGLFRCSHFGCLFTSPEYTNSSSL